MPGGYPISTGILRVQFTWLKSRQVCHFSFDISNTDHVKTVHLLDRVTIICPHPTSPDLYEYSKLYVVSRSEYDACELRNPRLLGSCATADQQSSISVVFRDFSPIPGALEFQSGQSYYVIATSDGSSEGINRTLGGLCSTKNMKLKFEVLQPDLAPKDSESLTRVRDLSPNMPSSETTPASTLTSSITYVIHTVEPEVVASMHTSASASASLSLIAIVHPFLRVTGFL
uniref:Ephrin RBD domain-containing protein n=1 Tax=Bursaphelenchus xylophilus TaxID=6326 RepID=A0A1I7S353_BURXY